jgi:hypothetical protein
MLAHLEREEMRCWPSLPPRVVSEASGLRFEFWLPEQSHDANPCLVEGFMQRRLLPVVSRPSCGGG